MTSSRVYLQVERVDAVTCAAAGRVSVAELRALAGEGHFASGSMGPKVDAVCRFVEQTGRTGVITSLDQITAAVAGDAGTVVVPA